MTNTEKTHDDDVYWMGQALAMAQTALYSTAPNPRVGCIIVRNGQVLGSGATQPPGQKHAEIVALEQAHHHGRVIRGATVYVTLEPCSYQGRTNPCVDALIAAQPARVVIGMQDPNPRVAGRGVKALQQAGITVTLGVCSEEALALNPGFVSRMIRGRPWVWLKMAASLDGYIALPNGESKWITGPVARADGQHWRARSCVVLTGSGTVMADNPLLNVRDISTPRQPIRAVVDTRFDTPEDSRIFDGEPVWLFTCRPDAGKSERLAKRQVTVIDMPEIDGKVDLMAVLRWMADQEVNEVHVEAGARLSGAFLEANCVDELLLYLAPSLLGQGIPMARMQAVNGIDLAHRFEYRDIKEVAGDLRISVRHVAHWNALYQQAVQQAEP